jgi:hypothetical protein
MQEASTAQFRARRVLADCRWALSLYSRDLSGEPLRVAWVSILTLLRAVGHVLDKVDAQHDQDVRRTVDHFWQSLKSTKPEPKIYWEFIESERNTILKQYAFGFSRTFQVSISQQASVIVELRGDMLEAEQQPKQNLPDVRSLIVDGPFKGRSEKEVAEEAVEWWEEVLTEIERRTS